MSTELIVTRNCFGKLTKLDVKTGEQLSWGIDGGVKGEPILYQIPMEGTRMMDALLLLC